MEKTAKERRRTADNLANHHRLEATAQNRAWVERYERAQDRPLAP
jgi:hypothetical protein